LKSLTVLDLDGGTVSAVSYDSTTPVEQLLAEIALSIPDDGSLVGLLPQIKGARTAVKPAGSSPVQGVILGIDKLESRGEGGVSFQPRLSLLTDAGDVRTFDLFDLDVDYLQIGGGYEPPRQGVRPYVTVAAGLGRFGADPGHVDDSTGLSGSIGGGFKLPLSKKTLFRLEARGWAMVTSSSTAVVCGPGCSVSFSGEGWWQFGVRAAFSYLP